MCEHRWPAIAGMAGWSKATNGEPIANEYESGDRVSFTGQKNTIHQLTIVLSTSKNVLCPGHNHLLTTGTDDPSL